jgi:hypothetical protein
MLAVSGVQSAGGEETPVIIPRLQLRMPMEPGVTFGDLRWKGRDAAQQELRPGMVKRC